MPKQIKILNAVFLAAGVILLFISAYAASRARDLQRNGVTVVGHVIRLERGSKGSSFPVVEFQAGDERITFKSRMGSSPPSFHAGESVAVLYDPLDPQRATIQSFGQMWGPSIVSGLLGAVFTAIPSGILIGRMRRRKLDAWLRQYGQRVATQFDRVERNTSVRVNGAHPYRIFSQGQNPFTAQVEIFHSYNLWSDPSPYVHDRSIDVLIDPNNPKRYWLDTGFLPWDAE